jgi:hypothetical protein
MMEREWFDLDELQRTPDCSPVDGEAGYDEEVSI